MEAYVKPYPCCRWTQPGITAAIAVQNGSPLAGGRGGGRSPSTPSRPPSRCRGGGRAPARRCSTAWCGRWRWRWWTATSASTACSRSSPARTWRPWPAAPRWRSTTHMTAAFPARRMTRVVVRLRSGDQLDSGVVEAPGEPDDPGWEAVIEHKVRRYLRANDGPLLRQVDPPAAAAGRRRRGLIAQLAYGLEQRPRRVDGRHHHAAATRHNGCRRSPAWRTGFRARAAAHDRDASFPAENFAELREAGLLTLTVPEQDGGHGLWWGDRYRDYYQLLEELARIDCSTAQLLQVHCHATGYISRHARRRAARRRAARDRGAGQAGGVGGQRDEPAQRPQRRLQLRADARRRRLAADLPQVLRLAGAGRRLPAAVGGRARRAALPGANGDGAGAARRRPASS